MVRLRRVAYGVSKLREGKDRVEDYALSYLRSNAPNAEPLHACSPDGRKVLVLCRIGRKFAAWEAVFKGPWRTFSDWSPDFANFRDLKEHLEDLEFEDYHDCLRFFFRGFRK